MEIDKMSNIQLSETEKIWNQCKHCKCNGARLNVLKKKFVNSIVHQTMLILGNIKMRSNLHNLLIT